jgi:hypothetical protein
MIKHLLVTSIESGGFAGAAQLSVVRELGSPQNKSRKSECDAAEADQPRDPVLELTR